MKGVEAMTAVRHYGAMPPVQRTWVVSAVTANDEPVTFEVDAVDSEKAWELARNRTDVRVRSVKPKTYVLRDDLGPTRRGRGLPGWQLAIGVTAVLMVLIGAFPPYHHVFRDDAGRSEDAGYSFIFSPPSSRQEEDKVRLRTDYGWRLYPATHTSSVEVDVVRLLIQVLVIMVAGGLLASVLFVAGRKNATPAAGDNPNA